MQLVVERVDLNTLVWEGHAPKRAEVSALHQLIRTFASETVLRLHRYGKAGGDSVGGAAAPGQNPSLPKFSKIGMGEL